MECRHELQLDAHLAFEKRFPIYRVAIHRLSFLEAPLRCSSFHRCANHGGALLPELTDAHLAAKTASVTTIESGPGYLPQKRARKKPESIKITGIPIIFE